MAFRAKLCPMHRYPNWLRPAAVLVVLAAAGWICGRSSTGWPRKINPSTEASALQGKPQDQGNPTSGTSAETWLALATQRVAELTSHGAAPASEAADEVLAKCFNAVPWEENEGFVDLMTHMPAALRDPLLEQIGVEFRRKKNPAIQKRLVGLMPEPFWEAFHHEYSEEIFDETPASFRILAPAFAALPPMPPGSQDVGGLTIFAQYWGRVAPEEALAWAATLPPVSHARAVKGILRTWVRLEDTAALTWLKSQPPGPIHDAGCAGVVRNLAQFHPPTALDWAHQIADAPMKLESLWVIAREWGKEATPEFRQEFLAAIDATHPSEQQKAEALKCLNEPGFYSSDPQ